MGKRQRRLFHFIEPAPCQQKKSHMLNGSGNIFIANFIDRDFERWQYTEPLNGKQSQSWHIFTELFMN